MSPDRRDWQPANEAPRTPRRQFAYGTHVPVAMGRGPLVRDDQLKPVLTGRELSGSSHACDIGAIRGREWDTSTAVASTTRFRCLRGNPAIVAFISKAPLSAAYWSLPAGCLRYFLLLYNGLEAGLVPRLLLRLVRIRPVFFSSLFRHPFDL